MNVGAVGGASQSAGISNLISTGGMALEQGMNVAFFNQSLNQMSFGQVDSVGNTASNIIDAMGNMLSVNNSMLLIIKKDDDDDDKSTTIIAFNNNPFASMNSQQFANMLENINSIMNGVPPSNSGITDAYKQAANHSGPSATLPPEVSQPYTAPTAAGAAQAYGNAAQLSSGVSAGVTAASSGAAVAPAGGAAAGGGGGMAG